VSDEVGFVVELCERSLAEVKISELSLDQKIEYAVKIGETLSFLHENFMVHGDVKPQNVLETSDKEIRLGDFGLARTLRSVTLVTKSAKGLFLSRHVAFSTISFRFL
jgi:serine/threonine protein kinase